MGTGIPNPVMPEFGEAEFGILEPATPESAWPECLSSWPRPKWARQALFGKDGSESPVHSGHKPDGLAGVQ